MSEEDYQAALALLREDWGSVYVDPNKPGMLRSTIDPSTGLLVGMRAALFAEIINRALATPAARVDDAARLREALENIAGLRESQFPDGAEEAFSSAKSIARAALNAKENEK